MVSNFVLLSSLFLVSAALASPFSGPGARLAHRHESSLLKPMNRIEPRDYNDLTSPNWAGTVWVGGSDGTFTGVNGTFNIPTISPGSSSGSGASVWVGIDGYACENVLLQTGVQIVISDAGAAVYSVWYQWFPDTAYELPVSVSPGDSITASVIIDSDTATSGTITIENVTKGVAINQTVKSTHALCGQDAEWILEDFTLGSSSNPVPFVDFSTVTFSNAIASDSGDNRYTPEAGGTVFNIFQNGHTLTSVTIIEDIDGMNISRI